MGVVSIQSIVRRLGREWFLMGMICMVLLASFFPDWGRSGGKLHGNQLADIGIAIVFFLHGLGLSMTALRNGGSQFLHPTVRRCVEPMMSIRNTSTIF
jgi:sodium/bile acid cotransporter 7